MKTGARHAFIIYVWLLTWVAGPVWAASPTTRPGIPTDNPCVTVLNCRAPGLPPEVTSPAMVIVPRAYLSEPAEGPSVRRWPVVYLLHGYGGSYTSYWTMFAAADMPLDRLADHFGLILVALDGNRASWYLDAAEGTPESEKWQCETILIRGVIPEVDRRYRTWAEPAGRGVQGMSMGGHGALYLAARHPDLFGACGGIAGVVALNNTTQPQALARRLGPLEEHRARWMEHSVLKQAEKFVGQKTAIMIDCGWDDPFINDNRALHFKLLKLGVPHTYIERPGGHTGAYWLEATPYHLQFMADHLKRPGFGDAEH